MSARTFRPSRWIARAKRCDVSVVYSASPNRGVPGRLVIHIDGTPTEE